MPQAKTDKQRKAKPFVVYEYIYDMRQDSLNMHAIAYTLSKDRSTLCLTNGMQLMSNYDVYKFETPTERMFRKTNGFGYPDLEADNILLVGHTLVRFSRKEVLKIAHQICKSVLADRMHTLKNRVLSAQKELDNANKAFERQSKIWADLNKNMEND